MENEEVQEKLVGWDEAYTDEYVRIEDGDSKVLAITNWRLIETDKFDKPQIEFVCDVVTEDGKEVKKQFSHTSNKLKKLLQPILEKIPPVEEVVVEISRAGKGNVTQWFVKEVGK